MKIKKLALFFAFMLFTMASVFAHPPKKIELKFDVKTQQLDVKIYHSVSNKSEHYINNISIKVNTVEMRSTDYTKQDDGKIPTYHFTLKDVKAGDLIAVTAKCNKWGKKTKNLKVK
jgi:desulfoferrodoxin (superoxide reductase-like protein)